MSERCKQIDGNKTKIKKHDHSQQLMQSIF